MFRCSHHCSPLSSPVSFLPLSLLHIPVVSSCPPLRVSCLASSSLFLILLRASLSQACLFVRYQIPPVLPVISCPLLPCSSALSSLSPLVSWDRLGFVHSGCFYSSLSCPLEYTPSKWEKSFHKEDNFVVPSMSKIFFKEIHGFFGCFNFFETNIYYLATIVLFPISLLVSLIEMRFRRCVSLLISISIIPAGIIRKSVYRKAFAKLRRNGYATGYKPRERIRRGILMIFLQVFVGWL